MKTNAFYSVYFLVLGWPIVNPICYPSETHTTNILGDTASHSIKLKPYQEIAKIKDSMDYFIRNTASLYDKETNETTFRLPIFLAFLCNSGYNLNQKAFGLFQAQSPIAINTIVPRLSHYSISNINTKP